jgi:hypothetical protein
MRTATAFLTGMLLLAVIACARSSVSPTAPTRSPSASQVTTLTGGSYYLTLSSTMTPVTTSDGRTFQTSLCLSLNGGAPTSGRFPVTVQPSSDAWVARAATGTLTLALTLDGSNAVGQISGRAVSVDGTVSVDVNATATGSVTATDALSGGLTGRVEFSAAGGRSGCEANTWQLSRD